jgi:acylphosphatase
MLNRENKLLKVTGKVQGVFFRQSSKKMADEFGVKGYVKNCLDGSVEIGAEGNENDLKKFIEWCCQGPPNAVVINIEITESELKDYQDFKIRY